MIKGLYAAYSSMEAAWSHQQLISSNIANANTIGYKRATLATQSFADLLLSQQTPMVAPFPARVETVVGQVNAGQGVSEIATDFSPGSYVATGNELDFVSSAGFFAVQGADGQTYYTRDGRFSRDGDGTLVTTHGDPVLGADGGRITLGAGAVSVDADGTLRQDGQAVGQLEVVDFRPSDLQRAGESYFVASAPGTPIAAEVRQGFLESSNTSLVEEMTTLMTVHRLYQANQAIIARLDGTLDQAAGTLGQFGGTA